MVGFKSFSNAADPITLAITTSLTFSSPINLGSLSGAVYSAAFSTIAGKEPASSVTALAHFLMDLEDKRSR